VRAAAQLPILLLLSSLAIPGWSQIEKQSPEAAACGINSNSPQDMIFARPFQGSWRRVTTKALDQRPWSRVAQVWRSPMTAGTFVELEMLDDPEAGDWFQRVDYCFDRLNRLRRIDSRYNSFDQDSRLERFEFDTSGKVTKHSQQCVILDTEQSRPVDEGCKFSNPFPIPKRLSDLAFLKHSSRN